MDSNAFINYLLGKLQDYGKVFMNQILNDSPNIPVSSKIEIWGLQNHVRK